MLQKGMTVLWRQNIITGNLLGQCTFTTTLHSLVGWKKCCQETAQLRLSVTQVTTGGPAKYITTITFTYNTHQLYWLSWLTPLSNAFILNRNSHFVNGLIMYYTIPNNALMTGYWPMRDEPFVLMTSGSPVVTSWLLQPPLSQFSFKHSSIGTMAIFRPNPRENWNIIYYSIHKLKLTLYINSWKLKLQSYMFN